MVDDTAPVAELPGAISEPELWSHVYSTKGEPYDGHSVAVPPGYRPIRIIGFECRASFSDGSRIAKHVSFEALIANPNKRNTLMGIWQQLRELE